MDAQPDPHFQIHTDSGDSCKPTGTSSPQVGLGVGLKDALAEGLLILLISPHILPLLAHDDASASVLWQ